MNQKGYVNIILIVLVIVLAGVVGYLTLLKKTTTPTTTNQVQPTDTTSTQQTPSTSSSELIPKQIKPTPKQINWVSLIPTIRTVIGPFSDGVVGELSIFQENDITGDGIPEALVKFNSGATTDELLLMQLENNTPVLARFKQKSGQISYLRFRVGAGGAGRYGGNAELKEERNAVYFSMFSAYNSSDDYCKTEVYQWNPQTKIFEFNPSLSNEASKEYCSKLCSTVPPDLNPYFQRICRFN